MTMHNSNPDSSSSTVVDEEQIHFYSERLKFLWEQYMRIIQLILLLAGITILTVVNSTMAKIGTVGVQIEQPKLAVASIAFAFIAGLLALGWRFTAQILMERQVYGHRDKAVSYFKLTETTLPWALKLSGQEYRKLERLFDIFKYTSGPLLMLSWILVVYYFYLNIAD